MQRFEAQERERQAEPPKPAPEPPKPAPEPPKEAPEPPKEAPEPPKEAPEPPKEAPEPTEEQPKKAVPPPDPVHVAFNGRFVQEQPPDSSDEEDGAETEEKSAMQQPAPEPRGAQESPTRPEPSRKVPERPATPEPPRMPPSPGGIARVVARLKRRVCFLTHSDRCGGDQHLDLYHEACACAEIQDVSGLTYALCVCAHRTLTTAKAIERFRLNWSALLMQCEAEVMMLRIRLRD